jgi:ribosomal protein S18 acetylase RimI-like enzyme
MSPAITISEPTEAEAPACFALVKRVFDACVAPDYTAQGSAFYYSFVTPDYVRSWRRERRLCLVAKSGDNIVGIVDVRDTNHITMFFVDVACQNRGIGRRLITEAVAACKLTNPALATVEVNASPFAVEIYSRLGFVQTRGEEDMNGIRFTAMELDVRKGRGITPT